MRTFKWPCLFKATPSDGRDANIHDSKKRYHVGNMTHHTNEAMGVRMKFIFECQVGISGQTRNRMRREQ